MHDKPIWHLISVEDALKSLGTDAAAGLSAEAATQRLAASGPNIIVESSQRGAFSIFFHQFTDFMILVLLVAALISGVIGEWQDTVAILVIVVLNALVGAVQEYRAVRAVAALRMMSAPEAKVVRDAGTLVCPAADLVPGDLVILGPGNVVRQICA